MRSLFTFFLLTVILPASAQDLITSRQSTPFTYIYRLTNSEAGRIIEDNSKKLIENGTCFHTLVDSFPTGKDYTKDLLPGNYIKVCARKNRIEAELTSVMNINAQVVDNNTDLCLQLYDSTGKTISDAEVITGGKHMKYDRVINGYLIKKSNRQGIVEITYDGLVNFYDLKRQLKNPWIKRAEGKVLLGTPLKYVWIPVKVIVLVPIKIGKALFTNYHYTPFRNLWWSTRRLFSGGGNRDYERGYFVFNKPKYLPGDTVRFKAFLVDRKGKPEDEGLNVFISGSRGKDTKLGKIVPKIPGNYSFMFKIADSLDLDLDSYYNISLRSGEHKTKMSGSFRYEDYELKSLNLNLTTDSESQVRGNEFRIHIRGTDENDLNILDGRVEIALIPKDVKKTFGDNIFVPDTLLWKKMKLEPSGETILPVPDSLFPAANLNYSVEVKLIRSDNETKSSSRIISFFDRQTDVSYELDGDSVTFIMKENGKEKGVEAIIEGEDCFGNIYGRERIVLPYSDRINPYFAAYNITADNTTKRVQIPDRMSGIGCSSEISHDSLSVVISNPRDLQFNWFMYRANHPEKRGYGKEFRYNEKISRGSRYYLTVVYLWAGKTLSETFDLTGNRNNLNISVDQPALVYPGQKSRVEVSVTDHSGTPVEGVDLTAWSVTDKFRYSPPSIYNFPDPRKSKNLINAFKINLIQKEKIQNGRLIFENWEKAASLDTIEYYHFLYPENEIYKYYYHPADGITQFAPFVVKDGEPEMVQVIYVDNKPVYFGWPGVGETSYSFAVDSGFHLVEIRTANKLFKVDSVFFRKGMKLIMSINDLEKPKSYNSVSVDLKPDKIEKSRIERYLFPYRNNFGDDYAWLKQDGRVFILNFPPEPRLNSTGSYNVNTNRRSKPGLTGPVLPDFTSIRVAGGYDHYFLNEQGFEYEFSQSAIKMRSIKKVDLLPYSFWKGTPVERLSDIPVTEKRILDSYYEYQFRKKLETAKFDLQKSTRPGNGRLVIRIDSLSDRLGSAPLFIAVMRGNDPDNCQVFPGNTQLMQDLKPGICSVILMFREEKYFRYDSICIKPGGRTFCNLPSPKILRHDEFGKRLNLAIENKVYHQYDRPDEQYQNYIRQLQVQQSIRKYSGEGNVISGVVNSEEGPLPGAVVMVKGTTLGTITDINGYYSMVVPDGNNTIIVSFIGYKPVERETATGTINVTLIPDVLHLDEVVVVGYGVARKSYSLASSTVSVQSALEGRVAGVSINSSVRQDIRIRGNSSLNADGKLLYIIDGKPYLGDISSIDPGVIKEIKTLKDESMTAIYGSMASNGVIVITTNSGFDPSVAGMKPYLKGAQYDQDFMEQVTSSGSIRSNFRDNAYWKPDLVTDKNGKVSFEVRYPDDVTKWATFIMAMNGNKQSGQASGVVRSYKPLMAQVFAPRFLIEGDSTNIIGKILNYTSDTVKVKATTEINGLISREKEVVCVNAVTDTIAVRANNADTIEAKYFFTRSDGYLDGEERKIPVFKKGIELARGEFLVLDGDTTITIMPDTEPGERIMYTQADQLDVMNYEIDRLNNYFYECNEQMASKLKALLARETILKYQGKVFLQKPDINRLIRLLENNQNNEGCWGWWNRSETDVWISIHVLEALMKAQARGYSVKINKQSLTDWVAWKMESPADDNLKIDLLYLISNTDAKLNYQVYLSEINEDSLVSVNSKFRLIELKQMLGLKYEPDSVMKYEKKTLFGNIYFSKSEKERSVCNNEIQTTLSAYRIIRRDSLKDEKYLGKMRNYFFERRRLGRWQNTFETASVIENIIPDMVKKSGDEIQKQKLVLAGTVNRTIFDFPTELKFKPDDSITITKYGTFPVYITSYQHYWKSDPSVDTSDFKIETSFADNDLVMTAGKAEKMVVTLKVEKDAQYVMVEVPVPGGCSYESRAGYFSGACHTEFYKDHVSLFFENITPGNYRYEIDLLPRYTGKYTINPAKAELMYFPIFSSNNGLKQMMIK
jgi:alpha-2-macroglobulin